MAKKDAMVNIYISERSKRIYEALAQISDRPLSWWLSLALGMFALDIELEQNRDSE